MAFSQQEGEAHLLWRCTVLFGDGHEPSTFRKMPARQRAISGDADAMGFGVIHNRPILHQHVAFHLIGGDAARA